MSERRESTERRRYRNRVSCACAEHLQSLLPDCRRMTNERGKCVEIVGQSPNPVDHGTCSETFLISALSLPADAAAPTP